MVYMSRRPFQGEHHVHVIKWSACHADLSEESITCMSCSGLHVKQTFPRKASRAYDTVVYMSRRPFRGKHQVHMIKWSTCHADLSEIMCLWYSGLHVTQTFPKKASCACEKWSAFYSDLSKESIMWMQSVVYMSLRPFRGKHHVHIMQCSTCHLGLSEESITRILCRGLHVTQTFSEESVTCM